MSKDVIRPLLKAVADLPAQHTGLVLAIVNALRGPEAWAVAERLKRALVPPQKVMDGVSFITLTAPVDRSFTPKDLFSEVLLAENRSAETYEPIFSSCPVCTGDSVTMSFYKFGREIDVWKLDEELARVGLELVVDFVGLAFINKHHPKFCDAHPNGIQWKNAAGRHFYASFPQQSFGRAIFGMNIGWSGDWWFPVRPKQAT